MTNDMVAVSASRSKSLTFSGGCQGDRRLPVQSKSQKLVCLRSYLLALCKLIHADKSIDEILEQLSKGEATPKEQEIRNREHRGASKKRKNAEYCAEQKSTDLELVGA